jgi:hypothetical protein
MQLNTMTIEACTCRMRFLHQKNIDPLRKEVDRTDSLSIEILGEHALRGGTLFHVVKV